MAEAPTMTRRERLRLECLDRAIQVCGPNAGHDVLTEYAAAFERYVGGKPTGDK